MHHRSIVGYLRNKTGNQHDAEDIAQKLWAYVMVYFPEERIDDFILLRQKAKNLFLDHYRKVKRTPEVTTENVPEYATQRISQEAYTTEEERRLEAKFFERFPDLPLSEQQKEALWLHARYGYTYKEIEGMLSIASSTIGDWIALGRKQIQERLEGGA